VPTLATNYHLRVVFHCRQGCLWGGPPTCPIHSIDLRDRLVRVKRALTDRHGKSDLPCPCWLPPGMPCRCTSERRRVAQRGRNGAYKISGADPMGDNGKAGADGREHVGGQHVPGMNMSGANTYRTPTCRALT
jgi:hypothetical protein